MKKKELLKRVMCIFGAFGLLNKSPIKATTTLQVATATVAVLGAPGEYQIIKEVLKLGKEAKKSGCKIKEILPGSLLAYLIFHISALIGGPLAIGMSIDEIKRGINESKLKNKLHKILYGTGGILGGLSLMFTSAIPVLTSLTLLEAIKNILPD